MTSTSALMPGLSPSTEGRWMITSYFTMLPVHQPPGLVTEATEVTSASSVLSGNVTLAVSPGLMLSMMDS